MRKRKMLDAMSMLDDDLVAEAVPKGKKRLSRAWITTAAAAACFGIVLGSFGIYRLVGRDTSDIEQYRDSEYYPLIQKLDEFQKAEDVVLQMTPTFSEWNFFERLFGAKKDAAPENSVSNDSDMVSGTADGNAQTYEEATDNQVEGVIEDDLVKRSDRYIYYLQKDKAILHVYTIQGEDSQEIGRFCVTFPKEEGWSVLHKSTSWELYLSEDCRTLSVIAPYYTGRDGGRYETAVIALDVSDPTAIYEKNRVTVAGEYHSSRVTDGTMYLLNRFYVSETWDYGKPESFVPQIDYGDGAVCLPMSRIVMPEEMTAPAYTVICRLNAETLTLEKSLGCLSYVESLYASRDSLYLVRGRFEDEKERDRLTRRSKSDIFRISYADGGLTPMQTVTVDGTVKDQYSLDEHEGILRVVTSTNIDRYEQNKQYASFLENEVNASLFAVDIESMQVVGSVEHFAPAGETVRSVRFDGTKGYVCTAIRRTDPVFFFDLSDIHHITYTDTGTIPGFSTSLIAYGDGVLLGLGEGENGESKIEIYVRAGNAVVSLDSYTVKGDTYYATEYKSYLIDRENWLFGFVVQTVNGESQYRIFRLEGGQIEPIESVNMGDTFHMLNNFRCLSIDGYAYVLVDDVLVVCKLP